jgi:hypothetical protein
MAYGEVTGATKEELLDLRVEHLNNPLGFEHGVPFETAFCVTAIGKQPDEYDGPQRYCTKRASKRDDYDGFRFDEAAYAPACRFHGGDKGGNYEDLPDDHVLAPIKHGIHATDEHLMMDFTDAEQTLYDSIVEDWPDVYDWPDEGDDPARYLMLRKVARNVVRSNRAEEYLDDEGEVYWRADHDEQGIQIDENPEENALANEYRLLWSQIEDSLAELGLTPKARQAMDTMEAEEAESNAVADIAQDALSEDKDYDPADFEEDADG